MKRSLLWVVFWVTWCSAGFSQEYKTFENNVQLGAGFSWTDDDTSRTGMTLSLGYGLDIRLSEKFSLMPMLEYRSTSESMIRSGWDGADFNDFNFLDFSLSARWHLSSGKVPVVLGMAPYLSYVLERDTYYVDADPSHPLNGKSKLKPIDVGILPSVSFDVWKHFSLGAKMNIGLQNASEPYSFLHNQEKRYMKSIEVFLRVRF